MFARSLLECWSWWHYKGSITCIPHILGQIKVCRSYNRNVGVILHYNDFVISPEISWCMGAEAQIIQRQMGTMNETSAITAGKWVIVPQSAKASTWENLLPPRPQQLSRNNQLHPHRCLKGRPWCPLQHLRRPKIVRDKQTYWPS